MRHGSLFSGIGGFDLAAEWMGWENVFHCEWEDFPRKVLKYYWPNSISYGDIKKTDFNIHRGRIDIITGGFPCQPYSQAGKRLGKEDDRHLWPEMLRAIREIQPKWVVGENVLGIVNWNGGLVFDEVQTDLENEGYKVQPYVLPASGVGAPHQRYRVWFVAYAHKHTKGQSKTSRNNRKGTSANDKGAGGLDKTIFDSGLCEVQRTTTNSDSERPEGGKKSRDIDSIGQNAIEQPSRLRIIPQWEKFPTQSPVYNGNDGFPSELDGITFSKWRKESIKAGGNAIVPQVALQIFKAIESYDLF